MTELKIKAKFPKLLVDTDGNGQVVFTVDKGDMWQVRRIVETLTKDKQWSNCDLSVDIRKYSNKRSLDANAYFHLLVNKLAEVLKLGVGEVKTQLVLDYGTPEVDEYGKLVCLKLPSGQEKQIKEQCPYIKCFGEERTAKGVLKHWLLYKRTSDLDAHEMARLIDGAVGECKQVGIETATPNEVAEMISLMKNKERKNNE